MSLDADLIVDRRRMRRKLTFWRVLAVVVIVLAVIGAAGLAGKRSGFVGPYIARISIKALEVAEEKEAIAQYGSSDSGATLGDILGTALRRKGEESEKDE